jgi:hypothetical protein
MTDYPRFQPVKDAPDVAHRGYFGGCLVDLVLWIIDRRMATLRKRQPLPATDQADADADVDTPLPDGAPTMARSTAPQRPEATLQL